MGAGVAVDSGVAVGSGAGVGVCVGSGVWTGVGVGSGVASGVGAGVCVGSGVGSGVCVGSGVDSGVGAKVSAGVSVNGVCSVCTAEASVADNSRKPAHAFSWGSGILLRSTTSYCSCEDSVPSIRVLVDSTHSTVSVLTDSTTV